MTDCKFHSAIEDPIKIAVVIPAYQASSQIVEVLVSIPPWIFAIVVVDDGSLDETTNKVSNRAESDNRIQLICHSKNLGIAAAMQTGIERAILNGAEIIVKMDSDGQMLADDLPSLLAPLIDGVADCTKGNRFRDFNALRQMPIVRRIGNLGLSMLCKAAVGYWNVFDPTNGFIAIRSDVLKQISSARLKGYYFFEIGLLAELYLIGAVVKDVPISARYGEERSNMLLHRILASYPPRLAGLFLRRIGLKYFLYDFTVASLYILAGVSSLATGMLFGTVNWINYSRQGIGAPTGTVVISAVLILLGVQLVLAAVQADLGSVPTLPLSSERRNLNSKTWRPIPAASFKDLSNKRIPRD